MSLKFVSFQPNHLDELISFLTTERWEFHGQPIVSQQMVVNAFERGFYTGIDTKSFLIREGDQTVGFMRLFDLEDPIALFDLRISSDFRGKGFGKQAVNWLTTYLFQTCMNLIRVEAHTRVDNHPMRRTLASCKYVMEGYHRQAWRQANQLYDSVSYATLRSDWESGNVTPIPIEEFIRS
ncbi:GNAT family N-acetyltransferase [Hazenella coriacea]|uniref:RimJ/RimL family protein N-acetyltransferase n=1 Tax=Hazenella coriacea TaxID=1179467 RepID=A0A4R3LC46_9BACL|nr:GNAT family protein [Hazenella coriacea]TCS96830.1 RimJ/RimL family protein N-acetyltransferase [Hazenella coriacea]